MLTLRPMTPADFDEVAELIFLSTNSWYRQRLGYAVLAGQPEDCRIFCDVYEALEPGQAVVVENSATGRLVGSCFCHERETHTSLGIMNVHPSYFGRGVAGMLLREIIGRGEARGLPIRLVSSALNLDSYSLYNRFGFVPTAIFQDMLVTVPTDGFPPPPEQTRLPAVRPAEPGDVDAMQELEHRVAGVCRARDYRYLVENREGIWHTVVAVDESDNITGFLSSIDHAALKLIGPGVAVDAFPGEAMLRAQLQRFRGATVLFILPAAYPKLIAAAYGLGARNCELHFAQVRGPAAPINGVVFPTYLPETA